LLRRVGAEGDQPGQFRRPNGIAIAGDLCLVVERDNHRVQALALPELTPVVAFGESELKKPYGIAVVPAGDDQWDVFVTDAYETASGAVPPDGELGERVKQFRLHRSTAGVAAHLVRWFGDTGGAGVLRVVESLEVDPAHARILIAEEEEETATFIKVYGVDGRFTGRTVGKNLFRHQVEGIALRSCESDAGWWVVSDQGPTRTEFHLLERRSLEPVGAFVGAATANTDGIAIYQEPFDRFPQGALFAVDDDAGVNAFRWNDVAHALDLTGCSG
jgi:3-phytase